MSLFPSHVTKFSGTNANRETFIFPVQLTTSRIGNLTRLIHTLAICMCDHTYILHACAPTARRSHLTTIVCVLFRFCSYFFMFPSFVSLEIDVAFSEYFVPLLFSVCMESTSYLFPFRMVFSYLVTTGWILTSAYVRIQSITQPSSTYTPRPPPLFYCCTECGGKTHHHQQ